MIKGLSPIYLCNLVPNQVQSNTRYTLRNSTALRTPYARTSRFYNFFTVSTVRLWNDLPSETKNLSSLNQFKLALKHSHGFRTNTLYMTGNSDSQIYHTRLRLGLSGLSQHLSNYHIINDAICQFCFMAQEDTLHFILHCPNFTIPRIQLLSRIIEVLPNDLLWTVSELDLINGFLFGFQDVSLSINRQVFQLVQDYINSTCRF